MKSKKTLSTSPPSLSQLRDHAVRAAHGAGKILLRYYGKKIKIAEKPDAGLVTQADLEAQEHAVKVLQKAFPDFGFLTEEAKPIIRPSPGRWIIDPLDGTTNYVHRFPMFCVSIAAQWNQELVVGVIYHPILDETYTAIRGQGAFLNKKRIYVSATQELRDALLTTGFTYQKDEWLKKEMAPFEKLSSVARGIRRPGSAALDLAYTARGVFDGFWERRLSPWDIAAGIVLVTEAGGTVSDFQGGPFQLDGGELLVSNTQLHPAMLESVKK